MEATNVCAGWPEQTANRMNISIDREVAGLVQIRMTLCMLSWISVTSEGAGVALWATKTHPGEMSMECGNRKNRDRLLRCVAREELARPFDEENYRV